MVRFTHGFLYDNLNRSRAQHSDIREASYGWGSRFNFTGYRDRFSFNRQIRLEKRLLMRSRYSESSQSGALFDPESASKFVARSRYEVGWIR